MSVRLREWKDSSGKARSAWLVDVVFEHADGRVQRVKKFSPVNTRRGAEEYERQVRDSLLKGRAGAVPTLSDFAPKFLTHAETNNKPSSVAAKRMILREHLEPTFGRLTLDRIDAYAIERFKATQLKSDLAPKTVNNQLTVLRKLLALAAEWRVLPHVPPVKWLRVPKPEFDFLSFEEAERLMPCARPEWRSMLTLALNTGLRQGEILALRWDCVDLVAGRLMVKRNVWKGIEGTPKGGKAREIPLNASATAALQKARHLRGPYVFCNEAGQRFTPDECKHPLARACRRAGLRAIGWHVLRHTFASHLVMRGVPLKAVQELMGHAAIEMTMRYAHLSPDVRKDAVAALDRGRGPLTAHGPAATHNPA